MPSWLMLDLRGNQCAAGLLTKGEQGPPRWDDLGSIFYQYVSPEDRDARNVADLAFFKGERDRRWKPVLRSILDQPALAGAQRIPALFSEPVDRLAELLPVTLGVLLQGCLEQYDAVPVLAIVDSQELEAPLVRFFSAMLRGCQVDAISGPGRVFAGFALWDVSEPVIPETGRQWLCAVEQDSRLGKSSKPPVPELRRYSWKRTRFAVQTLKTPPPGGDNLSTWHSAGDLERAGVGAYALLWRDKLLEAGHVDLEALQADLAAGSNLLVQLKAVYEAFAQGADRLIGRSARQQNRS